jgi:hypothetical protein
MARRTTTKAVRRQVPGYFCLGLGSRVRCGGGYVHGTLPRTASWLRPTVLFSGFSRLARGWLSLCAKALANRTGPSSKKRGIGLAWGDSASRLVSWDRPSAPRASDSANKLTPPRPLHSTCPPTLCSASAEVIYAPWLPPVGPLLSPIAILASPDPALRPAPPPAQAPLHKPPDGNLQMP